MIHDLSRDSVRMAGRTPEYGGRMGAGIEVQGEPCTVRVRSSLASMPEAEAG